MENGHLNNREFSNYHAWLTPHTIYFSVQYWPALLHLGALHVLRNPIPRCLRFHGALWDNFGFHFPIAHRQFLGFLNIDLDSLYDLTAIRPNC